MQEKTLSSPSLSVRMVQLTRIDKRDLRKIFRCLCGG
jgi:hypothetical protein